MQMSELVTSNDLHTDQVDVESFIKIDFTNMTLLDVGHNEEITMRNINAITYINPKQLEDLENGMNDGDLSRLSTLNYPSAINQEQFIQPQKLTRSQEVEKPKKKRTRLTETEDEMRQRKLLRNRAAAKCSRDKKKQYIQFMKDRIAKLTEENETLKNQVEQLKTMLLYPTQVMEHLERLKAQPSHVQSDPSLSNDTNIDFLIESPKSQ